MVDLRCFLGAEIPRGRTGSAAIIESTLVQVAWLVTVRNENEHARQLLRK